MQLIQVTPTGALVALRARKGAGLDLAQFGRAEVVRSTEIEWNETEQAWGCLFKQGDLHGCRLTVQTVQHAAEDRGVPCPPLLSDRPGVALFADYEDAVAAEVLVIQWLRSLYGPGVA